MNPAGGHIPAAEITYHPASYADPEARLFQWRGQLYRGIRRSRKEFYDRLFREGIIQGLVDKGLLVQTELTDLSLAGYDLILRHEGVEFVSFPYEWCGEMLKDAAVLIVDLQAELTRHGLALHDGHPFNVLFVGSRPVFVDFGSIVTGDGGAPWKAYEEFRRYLLNPLQLMARGQGRIARLLLHDIYTGLPDAELEAMTSGIGASVRPRELLRRLARQLRHRLVPAVGKRTPARLQPFLKRQLAGVQASFRRHVIHQNQTPQEFIEQVRSRIERIDLPVAASAWSGYHESGWLPFSPSADWTHKHRTVHRVLSELRPASVLDVAANEGWFSHLAAELGSSVVAFDVDEATATKLYRRNKGARLPILQLVMDVRNPSPGFGLCNLSYPPALQRLSCEMVLALALIHHLVFKQSLHFEQIARTLGAFSRKWLLLEFIPVEDQFVRLWSPEKYPWYNLDNLTAALREHFRAVQVLPSAPEPRVLLLCGK